MARACSRCSGTISSWDKKAENYRSDHPLCGSCVKHEQSRKENKITSVLSDESQREDSAALKIEELEKQLSYFKTKWKFARERLEKIRYGVDPLTYLVGQAISALLVGKKTAAIDLIELGEEAAKVAKAAIKAMEKTDD